MKLEFTSNARKRQIQIILYCVETFGNKVARRFVSEMEHLLRLLLNNPYMGALEPALINEKKDYRYWVIHPYKMIYYVDEFTETIYIVTFFDTRQDPAKLPATVK